MFWDIFFQCYLFFYSFSRTGHPWGMQLLQLNVSQHSVLSCSLTVPVIEQLQSRPRPSPLLCTRAAFPGAVPPPARGGPGGSRASTSLGAGVCRFKGRPGRAGQAGLGAPAPFLLLDSRGPPSIPFPEAWACGRPAQGAGGALPAALSCVPAVCRPAACQGQT